MKKELQSVELEFGKVKLSCPVEDGHRMIPVRTVCKIINVDFGRQDSWLKKHPFFSQLYNAVPTVGADKKGRTMNCLSIFDIDGWVHSIGVKGRKDGSIKKQYEFLAWLREQKLGLYKSIDVFMKENQYELDLIQKKDKAMDEILKYQGLVKESKEAIKQIDQRLEEVRGHRYTGQTALDFEGE